MSGNGRPIRFGVFEVDQQTGELRKQGLKIKLRDQPFQILLLLLAHPGEVVSRDELQKQLWPGDTFVDFDRGLNKAVNHLRDALGDSAESPRFIETLPKRGYRFIASVDASPSNGHPPEPTRETQHALAGGPEPAADARLGARGVNRGLELKLSTRLPWMIAGLASLVALISGGLLWRATRPVERAMMRFSVDLGPEAIRESGEFFNPVISPDGTRFVFPAKAADGSEQLATRRLDQPTVTILAGTAGAVDPFFSPDGQWVGFFAGQKLKKISLQGGGVVSVSDAAPAGRGASWGEDGAIFANLDRFHLFRVPAAGGDPQVIGEPEKHGERTWRWPQVLPGGENVLFTGAVAASASAMDSANIEVLSLKSGRVKVVRRGGYFGRYLPSGHLTYIRQGTLYGVPFDLGRLEIHGAPAPMVEDIADSSEVSFSRTGTLLYVSAAKRVAPISWLDSAGKSQRILSPSLDTSRQAETPRLSPDGNRLALAVAGDLFVYDLQRGTATRLTTDGALNRHPVWTPDGQHLIYGSDVPASDGEFTIWWIRGDGSGQPEKLFGERTPLQAFSISPDGRTLAFVRTGEDKGFEIWTLPLGLNDPDHPKPGKPEPFARESLSQVDPAFSPDGGWIAYVSTNGAGKGGQITVRPFPPGNSAGRWPISESEMGAKFPVWSRNRKELFYVNSDNRIMVVGYKTDGRSFLPEKPRLWSTAPLFRPTNNSLWNLDIGPDGRRFVVLAAPESSSDEPPALHAIVLLNFFDELRRRLPST
jgi:serine/threonine-protein kinase